MRILRRTDHVAPNDPEAAWALVEEVQDGAPAFLRFNRALEPLIGDAAYAHVLVVEVPLETGDEEELAKLGGFEDALFGVLGHDNLCWAAAVRTTATAQRFLLYTRDAVAVAGPLAFLEQNFPLEFRAGVQPDPDWDVYRSLPGGA
jgi:Family of unknown function (DUF695)